MATNQDHTLHSNWNKWFFFALNNNYEYGIHIHYTYMILWLELYAFIEIQG